MPPKKGKGKAKPSKLFVNASDELSSASVVDEQSQAEACLLKSTKCCPAPVAVCSLLPILFGNADYRTVSSQVQRRGPHRSGSYRACETFITKRTKLCITTTGVSYYAHRTHHQSAPLAPLLHSAVIPTGLRCGTTTTTTTITTPQY